MTTGGEISPEGVHREPTSADRAVQKSMKSFDDLKEALLVVGVTEEQLQTARAEAEKRVRAEYRELELQDPASVLESALQRVIQTDEEGLYVQYQYGLSALRQEVQRGGRIRVDGENADYLRGADGRLVPYLPISLLSGIPLIDSSTRKVIARPSGDLMRRFIGEIIGGGLAVEDLFTNNWPKYDSLQVQRHNHERNSPPFDRPFIFTGKEERYITYVPTKIEGVELRISTNPMKPSVDALFTAEALGKVRAHS